MKNWSAANTETTPLRSRYSWRVFGVLALVDTIFLGIFFWILANLDTLSFGRFHIDSDRSWPEIFGYFKWIGVICLLGLFHRRYDSKLCLCFALIFAVILVDDSLELHENAGYILVSQIGKGVFLGLRHQDFGELIYFAVFGTAVIFFLYKSYPSARPAEQGFARHLVALIIGLAMFGVVVDMWHVGQWGLKGFGFEIGVVEDFGEQIMSSLIFAFVFGSIWPTLGRSHP